MATIKLGNGKNNRYVVKPDPKPPGLFGEKDNFFEPEFIISNSGSLDNPGDLDTDILVDEIIEYDGGDVYGYGVNEDGSDN